MGVGLVADVGPEATTRFFEFFMVPVRNKNTRIVYYHAIGEFLAWSQRCGFLVWKTSKCIPCRAQTTGYATAQSGALFLNELIIAPSPDLRPAPLFAPIASGSASAPPGLAHLPEGLSV